MAGVHPQQHSRAIFAHVPAHASWHLSRVLHGCLRAATEKPQKLGAQNEEKDSLLVVEAGSPRSRPRRATLPPEALGEGPSCLLQLPRAPLALRLVAVSRQSLPLWSHGFPSPPPAWVSPLASCNACHWI